MKQHEKYTLAVIMADSFMLLLLWQFIKMIPLWIGVGLLGYWLVQS